MAEAGGINFLNFVNPTLAAQQQKLAYQQALAQKMLESSQKPDDDINKLANPGGLVIPYSPLQGAAKIGQAISGKYMQDKAIEDQAKMYADLLSKPTDAPDGSNIGPTNTPQALGGLMQGASSNAANLSNPQFALGAMMFPDAAGKAYFDKMMQTNEQKNFADPQMHDLISGDLMNKGLVTTNGHTQPAANFYKSSSPTITPQTPSGQQATIDVFGGDQNVPVIPGANPSQMSPQGNGGPVNLTAPVDFNDPAAVAGATEAAKKQGAGEITDVQKRDLGKNQVSTAIDKIKDAYIELDKVGGITNPNRSTGENVSAYLANTAGGQMAGRAAGTKEQSIRNRIIQTQPLLINAIRQATGMSAKAMDSNVELQFYLKSASDPTLDIDANLRALKNLDEMYGLNRAAAPTAPQSPEANNPSTSAAPASAGTPTASDIDYLKKNPNLAPNFDARFGAGSAQKYMTPSTQGFQ